MACGPTLHCLEVADADGRMIFQSERFKKPYGTLSPVSKSEITFLTTNLDHLQYRIAMRAVEVDGHTFHVRVAVPTEPFDQALDRFRLILRETLPVLVVLASLAGYWLSGRALAPVNAIMETARGVGVQNLSSRLAVPPANDELRRLSETLNAMLARIEASVKRITQFTADASHDLRTPVALIRTSAELALRRPRTDDEYRENAVAHPGRIGREHSSYRKLADIGPRGCRGGGSSLRRHRSRSASGEDCEEAGILARARGFKSQARLHLVRCEFPLILARSSVFS